MNENLWCEITNILKKTDTLLHSLICFQYFPKKNKTLNDIPPIHHKKNKPNDKSLRLYQNKKNLSLHLSVRIKNKYLLHFTWRIVLEKNICPNGPLGLPWKKIFAQSYPSVHLVFLCTDKSDPSVYLVFLCTDESYPSVCLVFFVQADPKPPFALFFLYRLILPHRLPCFFCTGES